MQVLIVEDDAALSLFLRRGLELEGHTAVCVGNGDEAVEVAHRDSPDLIILDLNLPRRDGVEVLQELRAGSLNSSVLVLTGRGAVEDKISCLDLGADDYLLKPFSFYEMLARCRALARRRDREPASSVVQHGALQLDRMTRSVTLNGSEIELTGKEFALLDYLLQNRGRAVSRPELLSKVWKMSPDAGTNVVDVYVNYLRRKLQSGDAPDIIETVRGEGYRIRPLASPVDVLAKRPASAHKPYAGAASYAGAA